MLLSTENVKRYDLKVKIPEKYVFLQNQNSIVCETKLGPTLKEQLWKLFLHIFLNNLTHSRERDNGL